MSAQKSKKTQASRTALLIIFLIYSAFIALGLPDSMFGVAWPAMRKGFGVPIDAMGMAVVSGLAGYLLSSFLSGRLIAWLSIRGLQILSCALFGAALITDCLVPAWTWFAATSLALGFGAGGIDAGLNTYVATHFGGRQMHWLHACYGVGVTLGPLLMTASLNRLDGWRPAYLGVGFFQLAVAAVFVFSAPLWRRFDLAGRPGQKKKLTDYDTPLIKTLGHLPTWLGMILFFLYSGAEFSLGFWAYSLLTESRGVAPILAGIVTGGYWGLFTVGRILSGFFAKHFPLNQMLLGCLVLAAAGSLLLWMNLNPALSLFGLILTGFAIAPVFPSLVSSTQNRVGRRHASNTIGMQMSAAGAGSAFISALLGLLARRVSLEAIPASLTGLWLAVLFLFIVSIRREKTTRGRAPA